MYEKADRIGRWYAVWLTDGILKKKDPLGKMKIKRISFCIETDIPGNGVL